MDHILLCTDNIPQVTSIHNSFIENYMLSANGSYVKVYLYLAKCIQSGDQNLSISSLADQMENTEKDVIRALIYWEKSGLVKLSRTEDCSDITGIELLNPDSLTPSIPKTPVIPVSFAKKTAKAEDNIANAIADTTAETTIAEEITEDIIEENAEDTLEEGTLEEVAVSKAPETQPEDTQNNSSASPFPPSDKHTIHVTKEQASKLAEDEKFCWTSRVVESYLQRPVKPNELQLISYLYDNLHFSSDLILHLYDYCISKGKTGNNYVQAVALAWDECGVKTPDDAIKASSNYNAGHTAITKALALGRPLAMIEQQFVNRWQNEWKMDLAVILEACNRTMLKIHRGDFNYIDGILSKWHKENIKTLQDVEKADSQYEKQKATKKGNQAGAQPKTAKNQFSSFEQREMTKNAIDSLEKKLINK